MSDPHLHFPYTLSDHAEREAIAQRHLAVRAGQPVVPLPTLPMVLRLLAMAAVWHLAPRAGVSHAPPRGQAHPMVPLVPKVVRRRPRPGGVSAKRGSASRLDRSTERSGASLVSTLSLRPDHRSPVKESRQ